MVHGAEKPVVAVRRAPENIGRAHGPAGAALVFDQSLLAELVGQLGGDWPGKSIGAAAGRKGIEKGDRFGGLGLRLRGNTSQRQGRREYCFQHHSSSGKGQISQRRIIGSHHHWRCALGYAYLESTTTIGAA